MKKIISLFLLFSIMFLCCSCGGEKVQNQPYSDSFKAYDTMCSITIYDHMTKKTYSDIMKKIRSACTKYDFAFDKYTPNSFVKNLNQNKNANAKDDNGDILKKSIKYSEKTNGAFDITISPIVELWGVNTNHFKVPRESEIKQLLPKVDYKQITFTGNTAHLTKSGSIDLGAIAKGFVTDKIVKILKENNVKSAIVDLGGNVYALGSKDGNPFKVGIQKPFGKNELITTVNAKDTSIITAGIYQRYKEKNGKIYSHIMNPKTGKPVDNDLNSVTVISKDATAADALSTGFMVMGLEKGLALANKTDGIEAVFIDKNNILHLTDGLKQEGREITIK